MDLNFVLYWLPLSDYNISTYGTSATRTHQKFQIRTTMQWNWIGNIVKTNHNIIIHLQKSTIISQFEHAKMYAKMYAKMTARTSARTSAKAVSQSSQPSKHVHTTLQYQLGHLVTNRLIKMCWSFWLSFWLSFWRRFGVHSGVRSGVHFVIASGTFGWCGASGVGAVFWGVGGCWWLGGAGG